MDNQSANPTPARKWFSPKTIFIVLGIIVVVELVFGLRSIFQQSPTAPAAGGVLNQSGSQVVKAKIALLTEGQEFKVGDTISVRVEINSPTPSDGVDLQAKFDPALLQAKDSDIQTGELFSQYPIAKIDLSGEIRISGITGIGKSGFSGTGTFATINFKAARAGVAKVTLDFTKGSTIDSNIASSNGVDLLEEVENLEVTIR